MLDIRAARREDLPAITEIYNHAILTTTATFDTEPKTAAEQEAWFEAHGERYPILVGEIDGRVVGWAALSAWSDRCAYADTAEISAYIDHEHRNRGHGRRLSEAIIAAGRAAGLHTLIARICSENTVSLDLCESLGFERIGGMREVGLKFGRRLDVHMFQLVY